LLRRGSSLARRDPRRFTHISALEKPGPGKRRVEYPPGGIVFAQGDAADAVFYVRDGSVKLSTASSLGKEAVVAIVGAGDFVGEGCLTGQPRRMATATAMTKCSCIRLAKTVMNHMLRQRGRFSEQFMAYLLSRNARIEADLVDQLFNSSEKRLARALLLLAQYGKPGQPETIVPRISQETLAEIVGTTRSRVSHFMNKFRRLGFIEYNGGLSIHSSLLSVVLHD
jgi:CRP-like cAMP-binding protein